MNRRSAYRACRTRNNPLFQGPCRDSSNLRFGRQISAQLGEGKCESRRRAQATSERCCTTAPGVLKSLQSPGPPEHPEHIVGGCHAESCESRRHRWRNDGSGAALSPRRGRLDRHPARGEGGAHVGLDVARGGAQCPSFIADYNMAKIHDYGVRLYPKLEEKTGQYVSWHGCGGIRFCAQAGRGGVVPSRRERGQAHRLPLRESSIRRRSSRSIRS